MIDRLAGALADLAVRRRRWVLALGILVPLAGLYPAFTVGSDDAYEIWFLDSDPALRAYEAFHDRFGNDELLLLTFEPEGGTIFTPEALASLDRVTAHLEGHPDLGRILSPVNHERLHGEEDEITLVRAVPPAPRTEADLVASRARLLDDPVARRTVVFHEGAVAGVLAEIVYRPGNDDYRKALLADLDAFLAAERERGFAYDLMGGSVLDAEVFRKSRGDILRETPLVIAVLGLVLLLTTRNLAATLAPLGVVGAAVVSARWVMALVGWQDNSMLVMMPLIVLAIGVADSVHIVLRFLRYREEGVDPPDAARRTAVTLFRPCFVTTFTTALGFLALLTTSLAPLRQLGVMAAVGVTFALVYSLLPLISALSYVTVRPKHRDWSSTWLPGLVGRLPGFTRRRRGVILAATALTTLVAVAGIPRVQVEANAIELFAEDDPVRVVTQRMERQAGGFGSLEVVIDAGAEGGILEPEVLAAMADLGAFLETQPLVSAATSIVDPLREMNRAMHDDDPAMAVVPDNRPLAAQYLLLYELAGGAEDLDAFLDRTRAHARVSARTRVGSSSEYRDLQEAVLAFAEDRFPAGVEVNYTGIVTLYRNMGDYLIRSQIRSFLFALLFITLTLAITFRSPRMGLLSLIPNVWPIALTVGVMGWFGIWLEPATAMVAAVAIGIAVDDSVHFLSAYLEARGEGHDRVDAATRAFALSGRAIVLTTVILLAGFGVLLTSSFLPYTRFAFLCGLAVALALVGDLLVLPAVLFLGRARRS